MSHQFHLRFSNVPQDYAYVRAHVAAAFERKYDGWSTDFDIQFDHNSTFLMLYRDDVLVAGLRITQRGGTQTDRLLPLEMGHASTSSLTTHQISVEYGGFWAEQPMYGIAVSILAAQWVERVIPNALAAVVYEASNQLLHRLYVDSLGLSPVAAVNIRYNSITAAGTDYPVDWNVALDLPASRQPRIEKLAERPYAKRVLDQCKFEGGLALPTHLM